MIVKAIPKDGGLFIPVFPFTDSNREDELMLNVKVVPSESVPKAIAEAAGILAPSPSASEFVQNLRAEWDARIPDRQ